jgi:hypothetical protein
MIMHNIKSDSTFITSGTVRMEPPGKSFIKQCFIRTPHLFKGRPVVSVTINTIKGNDAFVLYSLVQTIATGETIFKVSATNNEAGKESADEYWCDFMMIGELAK